MLQPDRFRAAHRDAIRRYLKTGVKTLNWRATEIIGVHRDGHEVPIEIAFSDMEVDGQRWFVGFMRDITMRKQAETALREAEEHLRRSQKLEAVGKLVGGIAHDFNNLLTGILGNLSLARRGLDSAGPAASHLAAAEQAGQRAAELTRQLLAIGRKSPGQQRPLDLRKIVAEIVLLLRRTVDPRIVIEAIPPPDLWNVMADHGQMHQVLMNLCVNACDAMPQGGRLTIGLENASQVGADRASAGPPGSRMFVPKESPGDVVRLAVSDTGAGMDAETRARIFEPFFTTKDIGKGTGLGLAMVYGIVTQHEGTIFVESEPGRGARFVIELPRCVEAEGVVVPGPASEARSTGGGETVLVVDDEQVIRDLARVVLEQDGYVVLEAEDGESGVSVYQRERARIGAVVLDLTMPKRSGLEVLADLRRLNPGVRVILSSGYSAEARNLDLARAGAAAFLQKPYAPADLTRTLRQVLS
jgi:hypothetical protein